MLAGEVGGGDLGGRALGEERAGRHRQGRGDRTEQAGGEDDVRAAGRAGHAGDDPEDRREAVVGAVDRAGDPAGPAVMPAFAAENPVQAHLGTGRNLLRRLDGERPTGVEVGERRDGAGAQLAEGDGVRLLLEPDLVEHAVGVGVAGRALLDLVSDLELERLLVGEQSVDRRNADLQAPPR